MACFFFPDCVLHSTIWYLSVVFFLITFSVLYLLKLDLLKDVNINLQT